MSGLASYPGALGQPLLNNDLWSETCGVSYVKEILMRVVSLVMASAVAILAPQVLAAKPSLRDVAEIENPLFAVAVAKEVADHCDSIAPRYMKGLGELRRLKARANELGYSDKEIRAHVESKTEKARMRAKGEKLLAQNGVLYDQPETFCAYGRAEIKNNSAIGVLLRAK